MLLFGFFSTIWYLPGNLRYSCNVKIAQIYEVQNIVNINISLHTLFVILSLKTRKTKAYLIIPLCLLCYFLFLFIDIAKEIFVSTKN